jgi:hypothetical protein
MSVTGTGGKDDKIIGIDIKEKEAKELEIEEEEAKKLEKALHEYEEVKTDFKKVLNEYKAQIKSLLSGGKVTEPSLYEYIKKLLYDTALLIQNKECTQISITINPPKEEGVGTPDLLISCGDMGEIGVVEAKLHGRSFKGHTSFESLVKNPNISEQVQKYLKKWGNVLLTSFTGFILFQREDLIFDDKYINENKIFIDINKESLTEDDVKALWILLYLFLTQKAKKIDSPELLAKYLAEEAKVMKDIISSAINREQKKYPVTEQQKVVLKIIQDEIKSKFSYEVYKDFADFFSQVTLLSFGVLSLPRPR